MPSGIQLNWDPVPDDEDETVVGYHIYRSTDPISDSSRGDSSFWLESDGFGDDGNGNPTIYPASLLPSGQQYGHIDPKTTGFELNFGEIWYYRFSAINDSGDEGLLSEEVVVTISQHRVNSLSVLNGFVGDQLIVEGAGFGIYDPTIDEVTFSGSTWDASQAPPLFVPVDIPANVISWSNTQILVEVPFGAGKGRVKVWIDGTPAFPLQQFTCQSPYLDSITPYARFSEEAYEFGGANFGDAFDTDSRVLLDGVPVGIPDSYIFYTGSLIRFVVPSGTAFGEHTIAVENAGQTTDTGFINVLNHPPVADFVMSNSSGPAPLSVTFNAAPSNDLDDGIASWRFDWDDGSSETRTDGSDLIFTHVFPSTGTKPVTLTVTDLAGATDSITKFVSVTPAGDILLVADQFNGAGTGNEFVANFNALLNDLNTLNADYVIGNYAVGISQMAMDQGFKVVIWNRGGPGPGDPIQDWPRNWNADEKADFLAILNAGIPTLLVSQNHQFTADFATSPSFDLRYGMALQNDTVVENGSTRDFPWAFGTATDFVHSEFGTSFVFPSSPVCLLPQNTPPNLIRINPNAAEQYSGPGSSPRQPSTCRLGPRIQGAIIYDFAEAGNSMHPDFIPGMAFPDADPDQWLCFSYGLETAPDANIGFGATGYVHSSGLAKLWVIGWSYSEAGFGPDPITRHDVLQNMLAWLDSSVFP
ncbi:MAG: PKD domain-containing protein [bacterium]